MWRWQRILCVCGVLAAGIIGLRPANATTFVQLDEAQLTARSVAVVAAWVTRVQPQIAPDSSGVVTYVSLDVTDVLKGTLPTGAITLREPGGQLPDRGEWIFGSAQYTAGESVLVFLSQNSDGTLRTTDMALGKFTLGWNERGTPMVTRTLGEGVAILRPTTGELVTDAPPETHDLDAFVARIQGHATAAANARPVVTQPLELGGSGLHEYSAPFTYINSPARWFEPDSGAAVPYMIDSTGDAKVGSSASRAAVDDALAAWTNVASASLVLHDGGVISPVAYAGCSGPNRIVFNDPFN